MEVTMQIYLYEPKRKLLNLGTKWKMDDAFKDNPYKY